MSQYAEQHLDSGSSMRHRLRAWFNVQIRLLLLFYLLLVGLILTGLLFRQHVMDSRSSLQLAQAADARVRVATAAYDAIMQFRVYLLRASLFASTHPRAELTEHLNRLAEARVAMEEALGRFAQVDAAEAALIRERMPPTEGLVEEIHQLAASGSAPEMARLMGETNDRFNRLDEQLAAATRREANASAALSIKAQSLHRSNLQTSVWLILAGASSGLLLTLLLHRTVVQPLRATMRDLRGIASLNPSLRGSIGDEFDEMQRAMQRLRESQAQLERLAYTHPLTGLPSHTRLKERLRAAFSRQVAPAGLALLVLDLDNFRIVNEGLGHALGDECLRELAGRLRQLMEPGDAAFHISGDRFAVLIETPHRVRDVADHTRPGAERLRQQLSEPLDVSGHRLSFTFSVGVACYPTDTQDADTLIGLADAALHEAKRAGRNTIRFAESDSVQRSRSNLALSEDIRRGVAAGEFLPYFQPIVDVGQDRVVGAEALLRWLHPRDGLLLPDAFMGVAQQSGQFQELTGSAFERACAELAAWPDQDLHLAFNLNAQQIEPKMPSRVRRILERTGLPARRLELEITESAVINQPDQAVAILQNLRVLGVGLSLDDFGTGYSSLGYLQRLPVSKIKIDRSFVQRLGQSQESDAIVMATLGLAQSLNLRVVAEGVETETQSRRLLALGCTLQQGFLFSPAISAQALREWVKVPPSRHRKAGSAAA